MSRENRYLNLAPALALAALLAAPSASAEEPGAFFEFGGFGHWLDGPATEGWSSAIVSNGGRNFPSAEDDYDSWGAGARAMAGIGVPGDMLPAGTLLELGGSWFENEEHARNEEHVGGVAFFGHPGGGPHVYFPLLVDGADLSGFLLIPFTPTDVRVRSTFDSEVDHWDLRLQAAVPIDLGESLDASARIGLVGGVLDQRTSLDQDVDQGSFGPGFQVNTFFQNDIDVEIDSWFVGPVIGGAVTAELAENIRFTLDAEVALLYHDAELDVDQTIYRRLGGMRDRVDTHETDTEDHFNARSRLEGTLEVDLGLVLLRLIGAFNYWTYAPVAVMPNLPPNFPLTMGSFGSARLGGADMMSAEAGASVVIPF